MPQFLTIIFYLLMGALVIVLAMGLINFTRTDDASVSRSNKLMRLRVAVQALIVGVLVLLGLSLGAFS